jgi:hypothetical protein
MVKKYQRAPSSPVAHAVVGQADPHILARPPVDPQSASTRSAGRMLKSMVILCYTQPGYNISPISSRSRPIFHGAAALLARHARMSRSFDTCRAPGIIARVSHRAPRGGNGMKKLIALAILVALAGGGEAKAQVDPRPDGIGMYFDTGATEYCLEFIGGPLEIYLILTHCSQPSGISGWECHANYSIPSGDYELGWVLPAGSANASTAPDFVVSLATPMPSTPTILLATYQILVFDPATVYYCLGPADDPSIPGFPAYRAGDDSDIVIPLHTIFGYPELPVAILNPRWDDPCHTVPSAKTTFGSVKALYR